jgi:dienelactone hydrolase
MTKLVVAGAFVFCWFLTGCGGERKEAEPGPFTYDRAEPLGLRDAGRVNHDYPVEIRDVSFAVAGRRVQAFLVLPPGRGPFPAVVYAHGAGQDRIAFLPEATWLAGRRVAGLVLEQPELPLRGSSPLQRIRAERRRSVRTIVELRRAVDVLQSLDRVDGGRIGFVGYSAGARAGAILAGVERRVDAFALASAGAAPLRSYVELMPAGLRGEATRLLGDVDPLRWVRRAAPARLLLQDGRHDELVPREALEGLAAAASRPKEVRWYDAGHALDATAVRERMEWLARELDARGTVPGALLGPE